MLIKNQLLFGTKVEVANNVKQKPVNEISLDDQEFLREYAAGLQDETDGPNDSKGLALLSFLNNEQQYGLSFMKNGDTVRFPIAPAFSQFKNVLETNRDAIKAWVVDRSNS
jgi:hypothetical protein